MTNVPTRQNFEEAYAAVAPWDIGRPQQPFVDAAKQIHGTVLDSGCGTGDTAIFYAEQGYTVTGIDYLAVPIERAKRKAADKNLKVRFEVRDALSLKSWGEKFDNIVDSGLFHTFTDEDRAKYVEGLASVLRPGGKLFLMCFSDAEPGTVGPRRVPKRELEESFDSDWAIESIEPKAFTINPDFKGAEFSPGGAKAWFMTARRK